MKHVTTILITFGMTMVLTIFLSSIKYEENTALVTQEECTLNKPSGTICEYEGKWVAKEVK